MCFTHTVWIIQIGVCIFQPTIILLYHRETDKQRVYLPPYISIVRAHVWWNAIGHIHMRLGTYRWKYMLECDWAHIYSYKSALRLSSSLPPPLEVLLSTWMRSAGKPGITGGKRPSHPGDGLVASTTPVKR